MVAAEAVANLPAHFLDDKDEAGERRVEGGGEPRSSPGRDERVDLAAAAAEQSGHAHPRRAAHMHSRALAAEHETGADRQNTADELDRQEPQPAERPLASEKALDLLDPTAGGLDGVAAHQESGEGQDESDPDAEQHDPPGQRQPGPGRVRAGLAEHGQRWQRTPRRAAGGDELRPPPAAQVAEIVEGAPQPARDQATEQGQAIDPRADIAGPVGRSAILRAHCHPTAASFMAFWSVVQRPLAPVRRRTNHCRPADLERSAGQDEHGRIAPAGRAASAAQPLGMVTTGRLGAVVVCASCKSSITKLNTCFERKSVSSIQNQRPR